MNREKIKDILRKIDSLPEAVRKELNEELADAQFMEQQVLNLSFNKKFKTLQVVLMGYNPDTDSLVAVQVDEQGRLIVSPKK